MGKQLFYQNLLGRILRSNNANPNTNADANTGVNWYSNTNRFNYQHPDTNYPRDNTNTAFGMSTNLCCRYGL